MTAKNPHRYNCPRCGREVVTAAKHHARQQSPCLACIRLETGWQHKPGCTAASDHRGTCEIASGLAPSR